MAGRVGVGIASMNEAVKGVATELSQAIARLGCGLGNSGRGYGLGRL